MKPLRRLAALTGAVLVGALAALPAPAATPGVGATPPGLTLQRVVVLMRHGVRPPTTAQPLPAALVAQPWPAWDVPWGHLTAHGGQSIAQLGAWERTNYVARGLLPAQGCPAAGTVDAWADTDQRTIATADILLEGLAPGCSLKSGHLNQEATDPLFDPIGAKTVDFDPDKATAAIEARLPPGGVAALVAAHHGELLIADRILLGPKPPPCPPNPPAPNCRLSQMPGGMEAKPGERIRITGPLGTAASAAQAFLLEYADGKPMSDVGWGRASAADIQRLSVLHSAYFDLLFRPKYLAARAVGPVAVKMADAIEAPGPVRYSLILGHDTNVSALGALLDLHWTNPGYGADDPGPGSAIALEVLADKAGHRFVRAIFIAQPLDQIRALSKGPPTWQVLPIPGCKPTPTLCPVATFTALLRSQAVAPKP